MAELWYPEARKEQGTGAGPFTGGAPKGLCHTTEGLHYSGALSVYRNQGFWPHFTATFEHNEFEIYQHLPINVAGKALQHPSGTGATNTNNVIQIEIVGSADKTYASQHGLYYVENWSHAYLDGLGRWMRWVEANHGVARKAPFPFPSKRLDWPTWNATSGWLGHVHVPYNSHYDPGHIDIGYLLGVGSSPTPNPSPSPTVVGGARRRRGGYALVGADGSVLTRSGAPFYGSLPSINVKPAQPIVGMAWTNTGDGYWLVGADGGVFAFGDAQFLGSLSGVKLNKPVVGVTGCQTAQGYLMASADGGVFAFGAAHYDGSVAGQTTRPIVAIEATVMNDGYWLAADDGAVYALGMAGFYGGANGQKLAFPIVDIEPSPDGKGYWLTSTDGGVFNYGSALFKGAYPGLPEPQRQGSRRFVALISQDQGYTCVSSKGEGYIFS